MIAARRANSPQPMLHSRAASHTGSHRQENEDRLIDRPDLGLWAVIDGMGGHARGGEAADLVRAGLDRLPPAGSGFAMLASVTQALNDANADLHARQAGGASLAGATVVAIVVHGDHFACIWAGDSRAYLYRDGALARITHDHSAVQRLIDSGAVAEADRQSHPLANVVTSAVGAGPLLASETRFGEIRAGDRFLLCSDGLLLCHGEARLADLMREPGESIAATLSAAATSPAARDNLTFVLIDC